MQVDNNEKEMAETENGRSHRSQRNCLYQEKHSIGSVLKHLKEPIVFTGLPDCLSGGDINY